ncbi:MAG: cobalamin biosynthesis protein [Lachnospiraceae bacterium]|nr:cobalamin biosynthesis protein [Lachnospiraceae bacterium]
MNIRCICFTENGEKLIESLSAAIKGSEIVIDDYLRGGKDDTADYVRGCFEEGIPLLFVSACGIAVRFIAPFVKDKLTDIPVIVTDEMGRYVIPILSGHVGGGNALASKIAEVLSAECVTTTATDINEVFSCDMYALNNRLTIRNKDAVKKVSAKALREKPITICVRDYPPKEECDIFISGEQIHGDALWLSPKRYVLGIGCKKGKSADDIEAVAEEIFSEAGIGYEDIYAFASIDLKAGEEGLLAFSARHRIPFVTFTSEMLMQAKGDFSSSEFVKEVTGCDNVCERAAMLLTKNNGKLVIGKRKGAGVTMALALRSAL